MLFPPKVDKSKLVYWCRLGGQDIWQNRWALVKPVAFAKAPYFLKIVAKNTHERVCFQHAGGQPDVLLLNLLPCCATRPCRGLSLAQRERVGVCDEVEGLELRVLEREADEGDREAVDEEQRGERAAGV